MDMAVLEERDLRAQDLLDNITDLVQSTAPDGSLLYVNRAWRKALGYREHELQGVRFLDVVHPEDREPCQELFQRILAGEDVGRVKVRFVARDGQVLWLEGSVNCRIEKGRPVATRGIFRETTHQERIAHALRESEARFQRLADGAPVGIFQTNARGRCLFVNRRWCEMTGQAVETAQGGGWARAIHPEDRERVVTAWNQATRNGDEFALECRIEGSQGQTHHVFARGCPVRDRDGRLSGYVGTVTAIDEVKEAEAALERSERRYRHLVESSLGLICTHDLDGNFLSVNPAAASALGYETEELVGRNLADVVPAKMHDRLAAYLEEVRSLRDREAPREKSGWMRVHTRSGEERLWAYRNSLYEEQGQEPYVLGHAHDITELQRAERAGRLLALEDEVTGLLNRRGFEAFLENQLARAVEREAAVDLVLVNPDDFEVVNDRFGREAGDEVLQEIARGLKGFDPRAVGVCRYGGAVFALIHPASSDRPSRSWVETLRTSLSRRGYMDGVVRLAFSAGLATFDPRRDGISDDAVLRLARRADEALQKAKMDGGGCTVGWTPEVETEQSGHRDRLRGIFTANLAKDYRNMLLLWDTVTVVSRNPDLGELTEKVLEGLRASFKPERVALFTYESGTAPRLVRGLFRDESWDLDPEERKLIETAQLERKIQHDAGADKACFAIPLIARGECLGCLYLDGRADLIALDASDRTFLEALADRLAVAFARAQRVEQDRRRQAAERKRLRQEIDGLGQALQRAKLVVRSPQMEALLDQARRVAPTEATVLVHGPSGTGKEVLARTLHELSPRRREAPVVVDCTAIAPSLIESELFGHEKGAFTGADQRRAGRLAEAEGSTLILDEIGELPLEVQSKLLRFVQEQEVMSVGGRKVRKVDTRVIALTHRDLAAEVAAGRFREDLFHRLNVVRLTVPPLVKRPGDILGLAEHFVSIFATQHRKEVRGFTEEAETALLRHRWPGNVRELQNRILRAVILDEEGWIRPEDLGLDTQGEVRVSADPSAFDSKALDPATANPPTANPPTADPPASNPPTARRSEPTDSSPADDSPVHESLEDLWAHLRSELAREVDVALAEGAEQLFPVGRWLAEDLVLEAADLTDSQREAADRLGLPETTLRRRLSKASAEVEAGRAVRSDTWPSVRQLLRALVHRPELADGMSTRELLPSTAQLGTSVPDRLRSLLLDEVAARVDGDGAARRGAALLGVSEPTYRRWLDPAE